MTDIMALRPGQADWETGMWTRALVALIVEGEPSSVPMLIPEGGSRRDRGGPGSMVHGELVTAGSTVIVCVTWGAGW